MALTAERLRELVVYDPSTGVFVNRVKRGRSPAGKQIGVRMPNGYLQARVDFDRYLLHRLAWLYVHGQWPEHQIDHINGDKRDNRLSNLRAVTQSQNMQNVGPQSRNKSGFRGVSWDASRNKWAAHICVDRKQRNLGRFASVDEAVAAYRTAQAALHPCRMEAHHR